MNSQYTSALVTGASSGIGAAVTRAFRERGLAVCAAARRRQRLQTLAEETGCQPLELDLRNTAELYEQLGHLEVDVLVNNAGLGRGFGNLHQARPEDIDTTIDTNVKAAIHAIRAVLPGMVDRGYGHIVNIGSVAGLYPIKSAIYGASKGAVHLLGQNMRIELGGTAIRVTEICPARVATEFFSVAVDDAEALATFEAPGAPPLLRPEDIADAVCYAVEAPAHVNVSTIEIQPVAQVFGGVQLFVD